MIQLCTILSENTVSLCVGGNEKLSGWVGELYILRALFEGYLKSRRKVINCLL